ncbi:fibrinogen alpha chain precursor [Danio rerio]|uniref:Fibrinogen alpha chain n=1 Tax=Danio rerio TaxID=7955 RepID=B8A5L6_DANRE|nr:fibrinogen alpha chain precursor [Danio rerio]|eukprot:NP_001181918.1 fibrinogen alpha chain precursor [Danio rerio]
MKFTHSLLCLFVAVSSALAEEDTVVNPRGARPIEHGFKAQDTCQTKEWPGCTDDDWGSKCPSGCRVQGLMDKADHDLLKKIEKIRRLLVEGQKLYRSADEVSKTTYTYLREKLTSNSGYDNRYMSLAEQLRQRITDIKIKIDRQLRLLDALKSQVKDQVVVMQRLEVDIDIKLRTCKGSCASYSEFSVDRESYVTLDKQMDNLNAMRVQSVETVSSLGIMKSRPLKDVLVPTIYKSGTGKAEQKLLFGDVGQMQLSLEAEGSTAESAATVSKFPTSGTGSTSQTSSKQCTKSVRKVITHTKDGPVEKVEVSSSGPGCDDLGKLGISDSEFLTAAKDGKDLSRDGLKITVTGGDEKSLTSLSHSTSDLGGFGGDFFKNLGTDNRKYASSSSSTSTKTVSDGSKSYSKTTLTSDPIFGDDLGAFMRGDVEEDMPDIHARSVKSQDDRKAGFVGGDCVEIQQKHVNGGQSGMFKIKPAGSEEVVEVYCDQSTGLGGWTLVQQREDGSVNFNRTWKEYLNGFGQIDKQGKGEIWIGNKFLHLLTQKESLLRVELQDWTGAEAYAEYNIKVGSEAEGFPLTASDYDGDAGDALVRGHPNLGSFLSHAGMKFSTFDRDSDKWEENCAEMYGGGWWYNNCQSANLNGIYYKGGQYDPATKVPYEIENGVVWLPFKPADYSLKVVRMKIRPV